MNLNQDFSDNQGPTRGSSTPSYSIPWHSHTGSGGDAPQINFVNIFQKKFWITQVLPGASAATAGNYNAIWVSPFRGYVNMVQEVHSTAGTDGSAVTLNLEVLAGTTASGGGTNVLSSAISLKGTANTVNTGTLTTTRSSLNFSAGNRLGLVLSGTPTALANVVVTIEVVFN